jgi:hypothetical protein
LNPQILFINHTQKAVISKSVITTKDVTTIVRILIYALQSTSLKSEFTGGIPDTSITPALSKGSHSESILSVVQTGIVATGFLKKCTEGNHI